MLVVFGGVYTLQGTNISLQNGILKLIFLFPRWDMWIPWRVRVLWQNFFLLRYVEPRSQALFQYFDPKKRGEISYSAGPRHGWLMWGGNFVFGELWKVIFGGQLVSWVFKDAVAAGLMFFFVWFFWIAKESWSIFLKYSFEAFSRGSYCWWKKSQTTTIWDV